MRVLVTGGRKYTDESQALSHAMHALLNEHGRGDLIFIQGGAPGADRICKRWCYKHRVHCAQVDAIWNLSPGTDLSAGTKRNKAMLLLHPDLVLATKGGTGTAHMCGNAHARGIKVNYVNEKKEPV